jgi:hypothetical protein
MNQLQADIYSIICSIVEINDFERMYKDHAIRYGLLNYIAKYSLARERYFITEHSLDCLLKNNIIKDGRLRRGSKITKVFTYEHPIPCNQIGKLIVENKSDRVEIKKILEFSDIVTILTKEENDQLKANKLQSRMPHGWQFFIGEPFVRYIVSGICAKPPQEEVTMYGSIKR